MVLIMKICIIIFVISFLLQSCNTNNMIPTNENLEKGNISIALDKQNAPADVEKITVIIDRDSFQTITKTISLNQNSSNYTLNFENLVVGGWHIIVEAYNSESSVIYGGTTDIIVQSGITIPVFLQLNQITGNIQIVISWGNNNLITDYKNNPILEKFNNFYDSKGITQSIVLKNDGKFHMWYNGIGLSTYIFHAESNDGLNWNRISEQPLMTPSANGWNSGHIFVGPVLYENGIYKMFFSGREGQEAESRPWNIGVSVSQDGINWTKNTTPILYGNVGTWDLKMSASSVIKFKNKYFLYYTGKENIYDHKIGVAISNDGVNWTKYKNNPILAPTENWEGSGIYWPSVVEIYGHLVMMYQKNLSDNKSAFGFAYSWDGLNWIKFSGNPVLKPNNTKSNNQIMYPFLLQSNEEFLLYYTNYPENLSDRSISVAKIKLP